MISDVFATIPSGAMTTEPWFPSGANDSSIDLLAAKDIGAGRTVKAVFHITANITGTAAFGAELQVTLNDAEAGDAAPLILGSTGLLPFASLTTAAKPLEVRLGHIYGSIGRRFLKPRAVTSDGSVFGAGAFTMRIVIDDDSGDGGKTYPSGFAV